jgi:hypothetical protein
VDSSDNPQRSLWQKAAVFAAVAAVKNKDFYGENAGFQLARPL